MVAGKALDGLQLLQFGSHNLSQARMRYVMAVIVSHLFYALYQPERSQSVKMAE